MSGGWLQTVESHGFSIGSDGVREYKDGVELEIDDARAREIREIFGFAMGESIVELAGVPGPEAVKAAKGKAF